MSDTVNREFIERKLDAIALYTGRLARVFESSDDEIRSDFFRLHTLERLIQLIVDEMIDINTHFIRHGDYQTPDDFQGSFETLARDGVFPEEFARRIAPTVGLRNRLVHRYEATDPSLLIRTARGEQDDFKKYIQYVAAFLARENKDS